MQNAPLLDVLLCPLVLNAKSKNAPLAFASGAFF
jgi:hypothetical protein